MDPITTAIVAALGKLAEPAVRDAYEGLKALIRRKLPNHPSVVDSIESLQGKPDSEPRRGVVKEELLESGADRDQEILSQADQLLKLLGPSGITNQHVVQTISGSNNIVAGVAR